ncbi:aspartyl protease family protein [Luteolibacter ambystomatis]|uniref:Aspartyl protease family protein n=1 Tax=Luteolibacter ambystomatis TaxID=2824561 RepID=A0A975PGV3_9BACT|nr:aspartyl protease family protein [Luteolibacter ambystomatis]QUE53109.1 aspartyl protease family protein [Luteolibacter ambystomatis]
MMRFHLRLLPAVCVGVVWTASWLPALHAKASDRAEEEAADERILCEGLVPPGPVKPLVQAEIAGKDHLFIFDTGSRYPLLIDREIGPALGEMIREAGSKEHAQGSYALPEVRLGELSLPPAERPGVEIGMMKGTFGIQLDGIIGWPVLAGNTLYLDHDHNRFGIIRGDWRLSPDATSIPILEEDNRPYLKLEMGGSVVKFLVDTGADSVVSFNDGEYDRLVEEGFIQAIGNNQKTLNSDGVHPVRNGVFLKGTLLGIDLKGLRVTTNPRVENILGELLLMKLNVAMSRSALRFAYEARKNPEAPVSTDLMLGIIFAYQGGHPTVLRLKGGGTGEAAGLEIGDVVSSIAEMGERPIHAITLNELCREKAGQTIHLKITRNGAPLEKEMKLPAAISAWN